MTTGTLGGLAGQGSAGEPTSRGNVHFVSKPQKGKRQVSKTIVAGTASKWVEFWDKKGADF